MENKSLINYLESIYAYNSLNKKDKIIYYRLIQLIHTKKVKFSNQELADKLSFQKTIITKNSVAKFIPRLNELGLIHKETVTDKFKIKSGYKHARLRYLTLPQDLLLILRHDKTFTTLEQLKNNFFFEVLRLQEPNEYKKETKT